MHRFATLLLRCCLCAASLAVLPVPSPAQSAADLWMKEGQIEADMAEMLSTTVVYVRDDTSSHYITGLLLKTTTTVVLTNYHLLASTQDAVYAYLNTIDNRVERFRCEYLKGDAALDLAVFRITLQDKSVRELLSDGFVQKSTGAVEMPYTNRYLSAAAFAGDAEIRRGYRVAFLGFPMGYGLVEDGAAQGLVKSPVFRSGHVASEIFNGEFLIDAMVSNGNSGSPVFVRSVYAGSGGTVPGYRFAGLMKEFQRDTITVYSKGKKAGQVPHNAGLGIVIPAGVVREFLKDVQ
jgi:S1-C subfamily serine protease